MYVSLVIISSLLHLAQGYFSGAPKEACTNLIPGHGVSSQTLSTSYHKFKIRQDRYKFDLGEKVDLTISVDAQHPNFKGFLVQALNEDEEVVGHFETSDPEVKLIDCDAKEFSAITHANGLKKSEIKATWVAPKDSKVVGKGIKFAYTIVEEKERFWAKLLTPILENTGTITSGSPRFESLLSFLLISSALLFAFFN